MGHEERARAEAEFQRVRGGGCVWPGAAPLEETSLERRALRRLALAGYYTVGDVLSVDATRLMGKEDGSGVWQFGIQGLAELCRALASEERAPVPGELSGTERSRISKAVKLLEEYADVLPEGYRARLRRIVEES